MRSAGGMLAAGALFGSPALAHAARRARAVDAQLGHLGLQLYTVRNLMDQDVEGTISAVAAIGYREVELAGLHNKTAKEMRQILDRHGLRASSSHISMQDIRGNWARTLDDAATLGQTYIVNPWIDESERTMVGYSKAAHEMMAAAEAAKAHGIGFAYHNHDFEFARVGDTSGYDILLAESDPKLVKMELDIFWIVKGGQDPLAYFARQPGRFPMVHAKDITKDGKMVDVGQGTVDWRDIFRHTKQAGIEYTFVEHDEPPSPIADAKASYEYLHALTF
ncbi:MAG TPA: sugar phosphate isomerase/epimerase [Gemmatimonadaceae bacterium]